MLKEQVLFSIIIPTYNRPERLKVCLESLACLDFPRQQFEVIVVDDGSAEPLDNIVTPFKEKLTLQLVRQNNAGPASARNKGASQAKGEFLVFTDDDCQPNSNWLKAFSQGFERNPNALFGGHTVNYFSENLYSEASQILVDYLYHYYNVDSENAYFFTSNNFALSKQLFEAVGEFNTSFPLAAGEDREFCDRWLFHHYSMQYLSEAIIAHFHHLTLKKFWRQHFNYGCGAFYFHKIRSERKQQSMKVEPFSFYLKLLLYPFSTSSNQPKILLSLLLLLSQVANISGFFWTRFRQSQLSNSPDSIRHQVNRKKQVS